MGCVRATWPRRWSFLRPAGVDVATGVESSPGRKDPLLVSEFIHAARAAEVEVVGRDPLDEDPGTEEPYDWRDG